MSKKVVTLLNKYGPMLSGELARKFEHEYGASNTAARQALSRAKKPVNKICTLSFDKNQKFFYLESQYMSNRYIERLMDAIKQSSQINWVYICAFQSQNGFVAKSILPSLVSSPIKNVKGHKLHQRVIDDLLKCGIIVEYNETHWMLAEWASIQNRSIARAVGLETVKKQVVNDFASWAQNINLIGYDSAKVLSASAEFANFQWALTAPAYIQPLYDTEKIRPGFVVADIFYGRTATEEDINFFLDKLSVIRTFKKLPAFMPVFLVENITREALMILKENKVMVALIKNVFDEKYAKLLAEIVSVFSHSSAIISKNPEKIETLFSEIAKAEGRYNLTYNTDICCFAPRVSNHEELGAFLYANEMLSNEAMALLDTTEEGSGFQERLLELLGEQHQEDHGGVFTDFGYAELGGEIKDIYVCQSNETACFHRSDAPVMLEVRKGFFNDPSYDNDKTAVLNLPAADAGIWRAVEKVDAASVDECAFRCVDCLIPFLRDAINNAIDDEDGIEQADEFAKRLAQIEREWPESDMVKYKALLSVVDHPSLQDATRLMGEIDQYELRPEVAQTWGYAEMMFREKYSALPEELFQTPQAAQIGQKMLDDRLGVITEYGLIRRKDGQPLPVFQPEQEIGQGLEMM